MGIEIRRLTGDDAAIYRDLRLRSVREHPEAFLASFEEESGRDPAEERAWLADKAARDDDFVFAAFRSGRPVGLAGILRASRHRAKARHRALLWGMYVAPEERGRGVGRRLVEEAVAAIARAEGIELVQLGVGCGNDAARALYERAGFTVYGHERSSMKLDGRDIDEYLMVRFL